MDISPGDSTPTSEASYSHSSTPTTQQNNDGPVLLANALPRLASHPSTPTNSQLHFSTPACVGLNTSSTSTMSSAISGGPGQAGNLLGSSGGIGSQHQQISKLAAAKSADGMLLHANLPTSSPSGQQLCGSGGIGSANLINHSSGGGVGGGLSQIPVVPSDLMNSNAPGPPVTLANLPKILSQITGNKTIDQTEINPQKALQTINNALRQQQHSGNSGVGAGGISISGSGVGGAGSGLLLGASGNHNSGSDVNQLANNNSNSLR